MAMRFLASNEERFWDWLGENYLGSSDFSNGDFVWLQMRIKTADGEKVIAEGDIITQDSHGVFRSFTTQEFEYSHTKTEGDA